MDPSDLRTGLAERLAKAEPIDAETFNAACFMLSRALEDLELTVPEAAPLVRRLLRVAGRVLIDTREAGASQAVRPPNRETGLPWMEQAPGGFGCGGEPSGSFTAL